MGSPFLPSAVEKVQFFILQLLLKVLNSINNSAAGDLQSVQEGRSAPVSGPAAETLPCQTAVAFPGGHEEVENKR